MGRTGVAFNQVFALVSIGIIVASGSVVAVSVPMLGGAATAPEANGSGFGVDEATATRQGPDVYLADVALDTPGDVREPTDPDRHRVSLPEPAGLEPTPGALDAFVSMVREDVSSQVQAWLPTPETLDGYGGLDDEQKRAAWEGWWTAAKLAERRMPAAGAVMDASVQNGEGDEDRGDVSNQTFDEPLPHKRVEGAAGLQSWWGTRLHGAPHAVHSAGSDGALYLVTDRGVVYYPDPQGEAEWMLQTTGVPGRSEAADIGGDVHDLVVSTHPLFLEPDEPSLRVVSGDSGELLFEGMTGPHAFLSWRLTDVDQDGRLDILGLDRNLNLTAIKLDGTEIYRKPLPSPELPEGSAPIPFLPDFMTWVWEQTGMETFGDATGDGTLDLFLIDVWQLRAAGPEWVSTPMVTLVSGQDGELVWSSPLQPESFFSWGEGLLAPVAAGDLTGDGLDDVVVMDYYPAQVLAGGGPVMYVMAGEDGRLLAMENMGSACPFCPAEFDEDWFEPLAVVDLNGDGHEKIVGVYRDPWSWWEVTGLGVWSLQMLPEGTAGMLLNEGAYALDRMEFEYPFVGRTMVRSSAETGQEAFFLMTGEETWTSTGVLFELDKIHRLDADGHAPFGPTEPLGHWDVDTATGQSFGWALSDDRWVALDDETRRVSNGTALFMSVEPLLFYDKNGDSYQDVLVTKTAGYRWLDGRTGSVLEEIERPRDVRFLRSLWADSKPYLLEDVSGDLVLYDVEGHDVLWSIGADRREEADVAAVADFTGDGTFEVLLHAVGDWDATWGGMPGTRPEVTDARWFVYNPQDNKTIWNHTALDHHVQAVDAYFSSAEKQLLVTGWEDSDYGVSLWRPQDGSPLWNRTFELGGRYLASDTGYLLLDVETPNGTQYTVLEGVSGKTLAQWEQAHDEDRLWLRFQKLHPDRPPMLVESYVREVVGMTDSMRQFVRTTDWQSGQTIGHYRLLDPVLHERSGEGWSATWYEFTLPGPVVGDWTGEGLFQMALTEDRRGVVRSMVDGTVVAAAPSGGYFADAVDLNGDGGLEVVRLTSQGGALQVYAYDPDAVLGEDGALSRLGDGAQEGQRPELQSQGAKDGSGGGWGWVVAIVAVAVIVAGVWFVKKRGQG